MTTESEHEGRERVTSEGSRGDDAPDDDAVSVEALPDDVMGPLVDAVARALSGDDRADRIARAAMRKLAISSHTARRTFARTVIGTAGLALRLAWLVDLPRVDAADARLLAAAWLVDQGRVPADRVSARFQLDASESAALLAMKHRPWPDDARARLVVERAVPPFLVERLSRVLPLDEIGRLFAVMNRPGPMCARVDGRRTTRTDVMQALRARGARVREGALAPLAIVFEGRYDVDNCPLAKASLYTVQDEGSQLIAHAAAPAHGERVLDWCAGRGGKTLALVELAGPGATVTASDVDARALQTARGRLRRHGADADTIVIEGAADDERDRHARVAARGPYDVVLVDAPCTSSGALRRGPDARTRIDADALERVTSLQGALLVEATRLVKVGGRIVYATCSVLHDENDAIVDAAIAEGALVDAPLPLPRALLTHDDTRAHLWPHVHGTDGFFIAGLRRQR